MKVAIDARLIGGTNTGDSTYWTCFLQALLDKHPDVELVFISNQEKPKNVPYINNILWHFVPAKSSRWWSMVAFPLAARKLGAQILHGQYGISPLAKNGLSTIHDVSFMVNSAWFSKRDEALLRTGVQITSKSAKRLITVSETSKNEILRYFPSARGKTFVALNACPPWIKKAPATPAARPAAFSASRRCDRFHPSPPHRRAPCPCTPVRRWTTENCRENDRSRNRVLS